MNSEGGGDTSKGYLVMLFLGGYPCLELAFLSVLLGSHHVVHSNWIRVEVCVRANRFQWHMCFSIMLLRVIRHGLVELRFKVIVIY